MFRSISWQLQFSYGLLVLLALIGVGVFGFLNRKSEMLRGVDESLQLQSRRISSMMVRHDLRGLTEAQSDDGESDRAPALPQLPGSQAEEGDERFYYRVWEAAEGTTTLIFQSPQAPTWTEVVPSPREIEADGVMSMNGQDRQMLSRAVRNYVILVGVDMTSEKAGLKRFVIRLIAWEALFLLGFVMAGYWLTRKALSPIRQISNTARTIADGSLHERVPVDQGSSELQDLSLVLNESFDHLEGSLFRQRQFTSDASHELRTPITAILAEGQSKPKTSDECRASLNRCVETARSMKQLVDQLLELSRLDAGESELHREATDLDLLVNQCIRMVRPAAEDKSIEIETQLEVIQADVNPVRITQVVINLLNNAVAYTGEGGKIQVRLTEDADEVVIAIEDNGVGISREDLPNIFNRFYRADKAHADHESHHFGLGLAISHEIAQAHGGELSVKSELGKGSVFTFRFPI